MYNGYSLYLVREECGWPVSITFGIIGTLKQKKIGKLKLFVEK
jgi:hypothetical protein